MAPEQSRPPVDVLTMVKRVPAVGEFTIGAWEVVMRIPLASGLDLKDRLVPLTAIEVKAGYLLTGNGRYFDHLYGKWIADVLVLRSTEYFKRRR